MQTKETLLKLIQDSTNELAKLLTEGAIKTAKPLPWQAKNHAYRAYFSDGNVVTRPTKEAAERAMDELYIFAKLMAYRDEYCPEHKFDIEGANYYIYYDLINATYKVGTSTSRIQSIGTVSFDKIIATGLCNELNEGTFTL